SAFLASFIDKGKLNPALEPTECGFYQMFSAWVFEDGLPFTTGESSALRRLFEYLHITFTPPTDTTLYVLYFIAIVMDNASACDTLADALGKLLHDKYGIHFHSENNRIRCLAHVVNLVVQAILKALDEAESSDDVDYFLLNKDQPIHYNEEEDEQLKEMEGEECKTDASQENDDDGDANLPANVISLSALKQV
ncbi:hypothetical protein F5878DRAFT_549656, partial [Lentinula raphanica]